MGGKATVKSHPKFYPFIFSGAESGTRRPAAASSSAPQARPPRRRASKRGRIGSMLRWLTAGESHGPALVAILEGMPAGVRISTADIAARAVAPPRGLRARRADEVRAGRGGDHRRGAPRPHARQPGRDPDRQHRMAQMATGDVRGSCRPRGPRRPGEKCAAVAAPPGSCRPRRNAEVRGRRRTSDPGAGKRKGNRGAGGAR